MVRFIQSVVCFGVTVSLLTLSTHGATIRGKITYEGAVPSFRPINMKGDKACHAKHGKPVYPEVLVLGDGNTMANVFVSIKSGLPEKKFPTPKTPVVLTQRGCKYTPHVFGIQVNQPVKFLNPDGILHNVNALGKRGNRFNAAMPPTVTEMVKTFKSPEILNIKCDVHSWMDAWAHVVEHPFFSVTGTNGTFTIKDLPAGTYELEAWHEKLRTKTATITVAKDDTKTVDFIFSRPAKKK